MSRPIVVIVGDDDALVTGALRGAVEEALGGEEAFLRGVLAHVGVFAKGL